jgi:hypothetical protein
MWIDYMYLCGMRGVDGDVGRGIVAGVYVHDNRDDIL